MKRGRQTAWRLALFWIVLALPGCLHHCPEPVRRCICGLSPGPIDAQEVTPLGPGRAFPADAYAPPEEPGKDKGPPGKKGAPPLRLPRNLPGADAPPIRLPPVLPKTDAEREELMRRLYPPLPPLGPEP